MVAAPNGVEIMAGLAWACGLIGLARADDDDDDDGYFLVTSAAAGVVLMTVRSLGPLWLALILAMVLIAVRGGPGRLRRVLRRPSGIAATGLVVLSGVGSVVWTLSQSALTLATASANEDPALEVVRHVTRLSVLWPFQAIAAFPYRNHMAPPILYAVYLVLALAGLVLGPVARARPVAPGAGPGSGRQPGRAVGALGRHLAHARRRLAGSLRPAPGARGRGAGRTCPRDVPRRSAIGSGLAVAGVGWSLAQAVGSAQRPDARGG